MATYNGREAMVTVNASTTEAVVTEMSNWDISINVEEIDTTAFGDGWGKSDVGMMKWSGSFSGYFDPADSTGQAVIEAARDSGDLLDDIRFYVQYSTTSGDEVIYFHPDTVTDSNAGARITTMDVKTDKSGVATLNVSFTGSGPITHTTETLA